MGSIEELRPEEVTLYELMREYHEKSEKLALQCAGVDAEIKKLTALREMIAKPYQDNLADIEAKIRLPMLDRKTSFICNFGKISYRKGATRRTWNLDALDQVCGAKPEVKEAIWAFRAETVGEPSISVKLGGD